MAENPNTYNDDAFLTADQRLNEVIEELWEAGADEDDIRASVDNAVENLGS